MTSEPDTQTIEDKDRNVVKKFRSVVEGKERRKQKKARIRGLAVMLIAGCTAVLLVFINYSRQRDPVPAIRGSRMEAPDKAVGSGKASATEPGRPDEKQTQASIPDHPRKAAPESPPAVDVSLMVKSPQYLKNKKEIEKADRLITSNKKKPVTASIRKSNPGDIQISKIVACRSVDDRMHLFPQKEFSVKADAKVYVWMDVQSKQLPCTLKHVYFINGRRYRAIPLSIRHPQMRTWSNISLNNPDDEGKWRVEVITDKGEIVSQIEFTVVP